MNKKIDSNDISVCWQQLNEKCDEIIKIVEKKRRKSKSKKQPLAASK